MKPCAFKKMENVTKIAHGEFKGHFAKPEHYDRVIDETTVAFDPDGNHVFSFVRQAIPIEVISHAWNHGLREWFPKTDNRSVASGAKRIHERKKDGSYSRTTRIQRQDQVFSGVAGYYDRYPRIPYCRQCAFNEHHPEAWKHMAELAQMVSEVHRQWDEPSYNVLAEEVKNTNKDFVIKDSVYTTLTINKNYQTAYHLDGKNAHGKAAMLMVRQGKIKGGLVVLPEYKTAFQMDSGDVIIFRNQDDIHGNTSIVPLTQDAQRCTIVHYFRKGMIECGSAKEELLRAKNSNLTSEVS